MFLSILSTPSIHDNYVDNLFENGAWVEQEQSSQLTIQVMNWDERVELVEWKSKYLDVVMLYFTFAQGYFLHNMISV